MIDFIMDILTFDEHSEIYSIQLSELAGSTGVAKFLRAVRTAGTTSRFVAAHDIVRRSGVSLHGRRLIDVHNICIKAGVNVIAATSPDSDISQGDLNFCFSEDSPYHLLIHDSQRYRLKQGDRLLYIADEKNRVTSVNIHTNDLSATKRWQKQRGLPPPPRLSKNTVLLAGSARRCFRVAQALNSVQDTTVFVIAEELARNCESKFRWRTYRGDLMEEETWLNAGIEQVDSVVIFARSGEDIYETDLAKDHGEVDAATILAARVARRALERNNRAFPTGTRLIAEAINLNNKPLFHDAGVDVVVPVTVLIERIFTKIAYSRSDVCQFILGLLAIDDGIHLYSFKAQPGDGYEGKTYEDLFFFPSTGVQILGVLPKSKLSELRNKHGDFGYHFITCPERKQLSARVTPGDELVIVIDRRNGLKGAPSNTCEKRVVSEDKKY